MSNKPELVAPAVRMILPLFPNHKPMLAVIGMVVSEARAKAFAQKPTPEIWEQMFKEEMTALLNVALSRGQIDETQILELGEQWLSPQAVSHLKNQELEVLPSEFVEQVFSGGMEISLDSPYAQAKLYLQAKADGDVEAQTKLAAQSAKLVSNEKMTLKTLGSISPVERVEIILANLQ